MEPYVGLELLSSKVLSFGPAGIISWPINLRISQWNVFFCPLKNLVGGGIAPSPQTSRSWKYIMVKFADSGLLSSITGSTGKGRSGAKLSE